MGYVGVQETVKDATWRGDYKKNINSGVPAGDT